MAAPALITEIHDPVNARILVVSEDRVAGFHADPFDEIARLAAGTIRRVRQTLLSTNLAPGALVAWRVPVARLDAAFDFMVRDDPFSGHVVIRSTDTDTEGSAYRLWTTLKVPQGFSMPCHGEHLARRVGAESFLLMPAKALFTLGVGHVR